MKLILFTIHTFLLLSVQVSGQVGINTATPNSTLTVEGSLEADYKEITASSYPITNKDHYLAYNGTAASTFTLPLIGIGDKSFTGRIYKIKNLSGFNIILQASGGNTLRSDTTGGVSSFTIAPGSYVEAVNNTNTSGSTWDLFYSIPSKNNMELYGTQLYIPPHASGFIPVPDWTNHTNILYDTPATSTDAAWWVISKTSYNYAHTANYHNTSTMTIVYEYQGTPFNLNNMYPLLSPGNNSAFPDVISGSLSSIANNGTGGRTRITVSVSRTDFVGNNGTNNSNWSVTFFINLLLARKLF
ncbi:hypothetical protein [uncultured Chryseobacterium sp.]|uniref:hypothetical protein n=1 Tax=uncultured Chryseobacterium sp. TaxID=259322 RepID=UPI0025D017F5|nr:hypothetical protein [uncultured Chryseobacterium sp.]